jgi:hypothetical protein
MSGTWRTNWRRSGLLYNIEGDRSDLIELAVPSGRSAAARGGGRSPRGEWPPAALAARSRTTGHSRQRVHRPDERGAMGRVGRRGSRRDSPSRGAFERGDVDAGLAPCGRAALAAHALGLGVNAGHDLDLDNLMPFRELPHLAEVSIGHALMSRALFVGLPAVVREYLEVLAGGRAA